MILKQSTAVDVLIGPFVDKTDAATAETGESPSVKLSKNGQTMAAKNDATTPVHDADGYYNCELDATDTNTVGTLILTVAASANALPVRHEFQVMEEALYDGLYADGAARVPADTTAVSGDTTAADNLELMYDGTGYTDDTAPASRAQVSQLTVGAGGISTVAESFTQAGAEPETNTYTSTHEEDGTYHIVEDDATSTDVYYQFDVGNSGVPQSVTWVGYAQSNGDSYTVYFYNWDGTSWDQVGTIDGANGTTPQTVSYTATIAHVGTGANVGKVRFRFLSSDGTAIATDRLLVTYAVATTGIANGSTVTLAATSTNTNFIGNNWNLALGGQTVSGSFFQGAISVTGTGVIANGSPATFKDCSGISATLTTEALMMGCGFTSATFTSSGGVTADEIIIRNGYSQVAGAGAPTMTWAAVTKETSINVRGWHGGGTWTFTSDCTASIEIHEGGGHTITTGGGDVEVRGSPRSITLNLTGGETVQFVGVTGSITLAGNTSSASTINLYGVAGTVTDNTTGSGVTLTNDTCSRANINTEVDTALSDIGLDHLLSTSVAGADVADDSVVAQLVSKSATADWDTYNNQTESLEALKDDGVNIESINGSTVAASELAKVYEAFDAQGNIASATSTTIVFNAGGDMPATDNYYNGMVALIYGGTGAGQARTISDYVGATRTATVAPAFGTTPDATSDVIIIPGGAAVESIVSDVLTTQMTEDYNADGAAPSVAQALHLIIAYLMERSTSGTTATIKKLDGTTTAATFTLNSATNPTSVTRAT